MAEVFTISGADPVVQIAAPPSETDMACAQKVKSVVVAGSVMRVGALPVGLFGTYKLFKSHWAAGVTALVGTGVLWFLGGRMLKAGADSFERCRQP